MANWSPDDFEGEDIDVVIAKLQPPSQHSTEGTAATSSPDVETGMVHEDPTRKDSQISPKSLVLDTLEALENRQQKVVSSQESWWTYRFGKVVAWIVTILFILASLVLLGLWIRHVHPEAYVVTFFVMAIAAAAYFAKVTGMGEAVIAGRRVPIIRYIDWVATTPLMLFELCMIGGAKKHTFFMVIGCDLMMLTGGIVSPMLVPKSKVLLKYLWFGSSVLFYILMIVALQVGVTQGTVKDRPEDVQRLFSQLEWLTIVSWTGYPMVVLLGRAHAGLISKGMEDALLCILDCISKIGMEGFIVATCSAEGAQCHAK